MSNMLNKVVLIGKIAEITSRTGATKDGRDYIAGDVMVETEADVIVPVSFFQMKKKKDGGDNNIYKGIETFVQEAKTILQDGRDLADVVSITGASLEENSFYSREGNLIRGFRISSAFFNRKKADTPCENNFVVEGILESMTEEVKNDEPTGRLFMDLLLVGYADRGHLVRFTVENEAGVNYAKNNLNVGEQVKIGGKIVYSETQEEKREEVEFGEPLITVVTKTERKLEITSIASAKEPDIDSEKIETILATRAGRLAEMKEKSEAKEQAPASKITSAKGFSL